MAPRRTSVPERIAGDILGFTTADEVEESQSVLAKYFPELSLRISAKGARGGRLGRAPQMAEQEVKYTPKEMVQAREGGAPTSINITTPPAQTVQAPDYTGQIEGLKQTLLSQSDILRKLSESKPAEKKPEPPTVTPPKVQTPEEQARETITQLYRDVLGREPEEAGLKSWMSESRAAGGITREERNTLERDFMMSPEYNIKKLYREELGREPDAAGLEYWTTKDPRSTDRSISSEEYQQLQQAFRQSPEYLQKYGAAGR